MKSIRAGPTHLPALEKIIASNRNRLVHPITKRFLGYATSLQVVFRLRCRQTPETIGGRKDW